RMPDAQRLLTVPGVGVLTATALVAFVGDIHRFKPGRRVASWLGLTPREHSSGTSRRLGSITRKGNSYLRMLLIHGARSALRAGVVVERPDDLRIWAKEVSVRHCHNVAAVALANKLARICWRVGVTAGISSDGRVRSRAAERSSRWRPVGPAWGRADNSHGLRGRDKRLAPHARLTIVARAMRPLQGPEIRLQSTLRRRG